MSQKEYTREELEEICVSNPHPETRRIAARMLFAYGEREQIRKNLERCAQPEQVPA